MDVIWQINAKKLITENNMIIYKIWNDNISEKQLEEIKNLHSVSVKEIFD